MQLHNLKRTTKRNKPEKVGRGGKRGKTSGRGTKGQNARSGRKKRPEMRDIIKAMPKLRGRGKNINTPIVKTVIRTVNLIKLEKVVTAGDKVTSRYLVEKGLINKVGGSYPTVKILGFGDFSKKIEVVDCIVSASAKEKIEKAGGKIV